MKESHIRIMGEALKMAAINIETLEGGPFGAVIVKDGEIIVRAKNSVVSDNDPTAHAEINAIRQAAGLLGTYDLSGCTLYSSCEPCPMCLAAIWWARIDRCYYAATRDDAARAGFNDELFYREIALPNDQRQNRLTHVDMKGAADPFDRWIKEGKDIRY